MLFSKMLFFLLSRQVNRNPMLTVDIFQA